MPSPNFGDRRRRRVDMVVLHYTGMATGGAALQRLCDPAAEVSCHYLVHEDGRLDQLVAEADRAWHAGRSFWNGETDINAASIGIEIVNGGHDHGLPPFPPQQVASVARLAVDIAARHGVPAHRVLGHSDVAPDRKCDPGERFPWADLANAGAGLWVDPAPISPGPRLVLGDEGERVTALQTRLSALGFRCPPNGIVGQDTHDAVTAFQRHWRPQVVDGVGDVSTLATLEKLLARRSL